MRYWILASLALFLVLKGVPAAEGAENCGVCHVTALQGVHAGLSCPSCHGEGGDLADPAAASHGGLGCVACHGAYAGFFASPMVTRAAEKAFIGRSYGRVDPAFEEKNCQSCHIKSCLDCHGGDGHAVARPQGECLSCHSGYSIGADYYGMAPREDHQRYQRGAAIGGEYYLKMSVDVHAEALMECGDCHSMASLSAGRKSSKVCTDCHRPDPAVLEHGIASHLEKLECQACHAAWAAQEYGTFYLRLNDSLASDHFTVRRSAGGTYAKSAYLKKQDAPPLGLNAAGRISPIRPQFIAFFTGIDDDEVVGEENRLLAAEWKAFAPHTIRRGTVMCDACHGAPRRFLLEPAADRIYLLREDGLALDSFWDQTGQTLVNGSFVDARRYKKISSKSPAYTRGYVQKWKNLVDRVEDSSSP